MTSTASHGSGPAAADGSGGHPLVERHTAVLDEAARALAARTWYSRYPESPSPRVYGEGSAEAGQLSFEGQLGEDMRGLDGQPGDGTWAGSEVSPYGPTLRVRYPRLDVDAGLAAASVAMRAWRDAGTRVRAAVCVEIVDALNKRSFEVANAVMHTSGQAFVMAFQAGGPHAQDRALEAVVAAMVEQERVPESVAWEKPGRGGPVRMAKEFRIVPRGVALVIGCSTFPTWNAYPGLFASLACGNAVVVKPHPRAVLPLAVTVAAARKVLEEAGFDPNLVQLAAEDDGEGLALTLAHRPEVAIVDYTGGAEFGERLERELPGKVVATEKSGVNSVVVDSLADVDGALGNLAFSLVLYSGQMCTAPQNIYLPRSGVPTPDGLLSFEEVGERLGAAVTGLTADHTKAVELLGALVNEGVRERAASVADLAERVGGRVVLASREVSHPAYPDAVIRTPALVAVEVADRAAYEAECFGPVAFLIATDSTEQSLQRMRETIRDHGGMTAAVYATSEPVLEAAREAALDAVVALSENLTDGVYVNQTAAFSDYHGTGGNPAANSAYTDAAFVAARFRVVTTRRHA